jgi:hypothetical protein
VLGVNAPLPAIQQDLLQLRCDQACLDGVLVALDDRQRPSRDALAARLAYAVRSRLVYARKHFTTPGRTFVALATLIVEPWVRIGRAAILGPSSGVTDVIRAYRHVFARQVQ